MQSQDRATVLPEHMCIAGRLRGDELPEREVASGNRKVVDRVGRELQIDTGGGPALVVLTGGVQEARAPAEGDRTPGASRQHFAETGVLGQAGAVEVGL